MKNSFNYIFYIAIALMIVGASLLIFKDSRKLGLILFIAGALMILGFFLMVAYIIGGLSG